MVKIISTVTLILMLVLLPPSLAMAVSNSAIPGQMMYPVKLAMEGVVLFFSSLTPYSKAYFALAQSERRYKEAAALISNGTDAQKSLEALVEQTKRTTEDIEKIQDESQKVALINDLSESIDKYSQGLKEAGNLPESQPVAEPEESPSPAGSVFLIVSPSPGVKVSPRQPVNRETGRVAPSVQSVHPTPRPDASFDRQAEEQRRAIEEARRQLEEYKRYLEMLRQQSEARTSATQNPPRQNFTASVKPSASPSLKPSPSPSPSPAASRSEYNTTGISGDNQNAGTTVNPAGFAQEQVPVNTAGASPSPTPVCGIKTAGKSSSVNSTKSVTWTYTFTSETKLTGVYFPGVKGVSISMNGQSAGSGQSLTVNLGSGQSQIQFSTTSDRSCAKYKVSFTATNSCGTSHADTAEMSSREAYGHFCED